MTPTLSRATLVALLLLAACAPAAAQTDPATSSTPTPTPRAATDAEQQARTNADETFDLNIDERRITRDNFEASTSVEIAGQENAQGLNLNLRVGVAVGARSIDVLLRNVRGRVRFRGSLEALLRLLNERHPAPANTPTPQENGSSP